MPDVWLMAGCVFQAVWNETLARPAGFGVKDYDVAYCDPGNLSYEAEDAVIKRADRLFADLDATVEVRNQARIHLWYEARFGIPYAPNTTARQGIGRFLIAETCVAIRPDRAGGYEVYAPFGLQRLFAGRLSPNPGMIHPPRYRQKLASYRERWPFLHEDLNGPWLARPVALCHDLEKQTNPGLPAGITSDLTNDRPDDTPR